VGDHDSYGKRIVRQAAGPACTIGGPSVQVNYGAESGATIDATVGSSIAVEIESRVSKQVRGAVLDLLCHANPKKLLILLPVHMSNPGTTAEQCRTILGRFLDARDFRVIVLQGSGWYGHHEDADVLIVREALKELDWHGDTRPHANLL